jgi:alpha 1,3-glucosidase
VLAEGDGIVRVRADEMGSSTPWKRYNETAKWVLVNENPAVSSSSSVKMSTSKGVDTITYNDGLSVRVERSPFKLTQLRTGKPEIVLNDRSLFHLEHFRIKEIEKQEEVMSEGEQVVLKGGEMDRSWFEEHDKDMFEERFRSWTDSKPKGASVLPSARRLLTNDSGPEALSVDITFPGVQHIYGLPEHASPLSLPDTVGSNQKYSDPYRLFNVDIFEYLADSPMSLYGAIPLLHAHSKTHSVGVLNLVGSETWVDVQHDSSSVQTHWMSESGIVDLLLLPGPKPEQLFEQYAVLTGPTPLPPQWSTAYHQCRWNYVDEEDVLEVDRKFDEHDIPLDVTWLDVEYTTDRRYFDWNMALFPDPVRMLKEVGKKFRKVISSPKMSYRMLTI